MKGVSYNGVNNYHSQGTLENQQAHFEKVDENEETQRPFLTLLSDRRRWSQEMMLSGN